MYILAVEQSTIQSSAVISDDSEVLHATSWEESRLRSQQFFPKIEALLSKAGIALKDVDLFAAGTGPGAFNALRMCISAMHAFSMPGHTPLYAVSSAQALALQIHQSSGKDSVSIIGDARRGYLWVANAFFAGNIVPERFNIGLIQPLELANHLIDAQVIASPDLDRIPELLGSLPNAEERLIDAPVYPHARFISETAFSGVTANIASPEFQPTYLHPPV